MQGFSRDMSVCSFGPTWVGSPFIVENPQRDEARQCESNERLNLTRKRRSQTFGRSVGEETNEACEARINTLLAFWTRHRYYL